MERFQSQLEFQHAGKIQTWNWKGTSCSVFAVTSRTWRGLWKEPSSAFSSGTLGTCEFLLMCGTRLDKPSCPGAGMRAEASETLQLIHKKHLKSRAPPQTFSWDHSGKGLGDGVQPLTAIRKCRIGSLPGMVTLSLGLGDGWIGSQQWELLCRRRKIPQTSGADFKMAAHAPALKLIPSAAPAEGWKFPLPG